MELTINHIAPYLPHSINILVPGGYNFYGVKTDATVAIVDGFKGDSISFKGMGGFYPIKHFKPILHPLSNLTKEITHNGETFVPIEKLSWEYYDGELGLLTNCVYGENPRTTVNVIDYLGDLEKLLEWHFDIFNLIENNLAIPTSEHFNPYR